jgi:hypothetical protein
MKISYDFLNKLTESKIMRIYKINSGNYYFEYAEQHYSEGTVFNVLELENEIISTNNKIIGYFGISFEHNILAYYLLN